MNWMSEDFKTNLDFFRRLKGFRRIFSRFDKLNIMFASFINIALIFDAI